MTTISGAERLKRRRKKLGLTQDDAARILGVSAPYIRYVEQGERPAPRAWLVILRDEDLATELREMNERHKAELAELRSALAYRSRLKTR